MVLYGQEGIYTGADQGRNTLIRSNGVTVHLSIHQDSGTLEQAAIPQGYGLAVVAAQMCVRDVVTKLQREVVLVR